MYYYCAILLLFWPWIDLRIIGSEVSPRVVCLEAAIAIQGLFASYSRLFTLKRAPSFMPCFMLTSCIAHLAIMARTVQSEESDTTAWSGSQVSESLKQGIASLSEMAPTHHIAKQALHALSYLAKDWNIDADITLDAVLDLEDPTFLWGTSMNAEEEPLRQLDEATESREPVVLVLPHAKAIHLLECQGARGGGLCTSVKSY